MGRYTGKTCRLTVMLVVTLIFFVAELVVGYMGNSIALLSDSFNMLSDLISLCVGLVAARVSRRVGSGRFSYGMGRAEVLGALANAVFLTALLFSISMEALQRLARPQAIDDPLLVLIVGTLGLAVNVLGLLIFQDCGWLCARRRRRGEDPVQDGEHPTEEEKELQQDQPQREGPPLNIRGVLLHVLNDALGSVVVVVASALFYVYPIEAGEPCTWQCYVDPSLTLVMVIIIIFSAAPLLKETSTILLQMSPEDVHVKKLLESVCALPGVLSVHESHIWELVKGRVVATLHVCVREDYFGDSILASSSLQQQIQHLYHLAGVHSLTLQLERLDNDQACSHSCSTAECNKLSCCPSGAKVISMHNRSSTETKIELEIRMEPEIKLDLEPNHIEPENSNKSTKL
ncbi:hypothetical protein DNTS_015965 [Danionella cerebrum]|uniref:Cation efflux protein cytoplasmic domain-containing protein n=1 Tax=Danionella cerebrum TaxID=2873325 RepID=A0A553RHJ7_9TELE|nr:hypothetical protein DNTS_015965 [Danionella translucida]